MATHVSPYVVKRSQVGFRSFPPNFFSRFYLLLFRSNWPNGARITDLSLMLTIVVYGSTCECVCVCVRPHVCVSTYVCVCMFLATFLADKIITSSTTPVVTFDTFGRALQIYHYLYCHVAACYLKAIEC